ncbi:hypothetical protein [Micromonospora sp. I033]
MFDIFAGVRRAMQRRARSRNAARFPKVHIGWRYIRYQEPFRRLELGVEPTVKGRALLYVPTVETWAREMPAWAQGRRDEILGVIFDRVFPHRDFDIEEY